MQIVDIDIIRVNIKKFTRFNSSLVREHITRLMSHMTDATRLVSHEPCGYNVIHTIGCISRPFLIS